METIRVLGTHPAISRLPTTLKTTTPHITTETSALQATNLVSILLNKMIAPTIHLTTATGNRLPMTAATGHRMTAIINLHLTIVITAVAHGMTALASMIPDTGSHLTTREAQTGRHRRMTPTGLHRLMTPTGRHRRMTLTGPLLNTTLTGLHLNMTLTGHLQSTTPTGPLHNMTLTSPLHSRATTTLSTVNPRGGTLALLMTHHIGTTAGHPHGALSTILRHLGTMAQLTEESLETRRHLDELRNLALPLPVWLGVPIDRAILKALENYRVICNLNY